MYKRWNIGRLVVYVGSSERWGVEVTYQRGWSFVAHVVNVYVCLEWWPE
jgi:hypothetical protein